MADDGTNGNMDTSGSQQNDDDRKLFCWWTRPGGMYF